MDIEVRVQVVSGGIVVKKQRQKTTIEVVVSGRE